MSHPFSTGPGDNREFVVITAGQEVETIFHSDTESSADTAAIKYPSSAVRNAGNIAGYGQVGYNVCARADQAFQVLSINDHIFAEPITAALVSSSASWTESFATGIHSIKFKFPTANTNFKVRWK